MDNTTLKNVKSHKHLGLILTEDLSWKEHIETIATSAGQCLDVLNALKYKLDRSSLEKLYFSFARSKLEYANIVWDNCSKACSNLLESVQIRAAKIITGGINNTSHALIYQETGWDTLEQRRTKQRLISMYKITHGQAPQYLQDVVPAANPAVANYDLRNADNLPSFRCRTAMFEKSFFSKNNIRLE